MDSTPIIIQFAILSDGHWVIGTNKWNAKAFSKKEAELMSITMINCKNCINCSDCTNCNYCSDCHNCVNCDYSHNCDDCMKCNYCNYCYLCTDLNKLIGYNRNASIL